MKSSIIFGNYTTSSGGGEKRKFAKFAGMTLQESVICYQYLQMFVTEKLKLRKLMHLINF